MKCDQAVCKLCHGPGPICNSHIIPEFMFKPLYNEKHKFLELSTEPDSRTFKKQKGHREPMLCAACENRFSRYENYVNSVLPWNPGEAPNGIQISRHEEGVLIESVDYIRFKLFQLSVLWRASESQNDFFRDVDLGLHAEIIRRMLIDEDPGEPWQYGCFVSGVLEKPGKQMDTVIAQPQAGHVYSHVTYRFLMGGLFWRYVVSSHSEALPFRGRFLDSSGSMIVPFEEAKDVDIFKDFGRRLRSRSTPTK